MSKSLDIKRYEIKYYIKDRLIPEIRQYIRPFSKFDPHISTKTKDSYTVRSIYYDTADLDYYFEKLDGLKIRKKLRIRGYNQNKSFVFLEIKRKYSNCIYKERINLPVSEAKHIVEELEIPANGKCMNSHFFRLISQKFLYNLKRKMLHPTLLVVYYREPHIGIFDNSVRLTIDSNVRSLFDPKMDDLFEDKNLDEVINGKNILELKYNNFMPQWMKDMTSEFNLRNEAISKYCMGIDTSCHEKLKLNLGSEHERI
ncbi:polyphosphate polymerase domain-containing protein [candidate division KSB1 bacterium]|nr:polyphosphate polymerase domain-containing protein [candidate division KSB1 bacterium]